MSDRPGRGIREHKVAHDTIGEAEEEADGIPFTLEEQVPQAASPWTSEGSALHQTASQDEPPMPIVYDRWGNAIQVLGCTYRVSQQPKWLQQALQNDRPWGGNG